MFNVRPENTGQHSSQSPIIFLLITTYLPYYNTWPLWIVLSFTPEPPEPCYGSSSLYLLGTFYNRQCYSFRLTVQDYCSGCLPNSLKCAQAAIQLELVFISNGPISGSERTHPQWVHWLLGGRRTCSNWPFRRTKLGINCYAAIGIIGHRNNYCFLSYSVNSYNN